MNDYTQFVQVLICLEVSQEMRSVQSIIFLYFKYDRVVKTREIFSFLNLINNSVTI